MKKCFKCNLEKELSEFYKHKAMSDGHLNKCKECAKTDIKEFRRENEHVRQYDRERYYNDPWRKIQIKEVTTDWRIANPLAYKAHTILNNAVRDGKIIKQPCKVCGDTFRIHGHHKDYNKPLEVEWYCAKHHHQHHNPL